MPWLSIISFLITFFLSKSKGMSTGEAAALAAGVGLATYYVADPANPDNLLGFGSAAKSTPGSVDADTGKTVPANGGGAASTIGGVIKTGLSEAGGVLKNWGPTGTLAVAAGTTALASDGKSWLPWIIGAGALLLLLR